MEFRHEPGKSPYGSCPKGFVLLEYSKRSSTGEARKKSCDQETCANLGKRNLGTGRFAFLAGFLCSVVACAPAPVGMARLLVFFLISTFSSPTSRARTAREMGHPGWLESWEVKVPTLTPQKRRR